MAALKKNIWSLFFLMVIVSIVLLISLSVSRWQGLIQHYQNNQDAIAENLFNSVTSLLEQHESIVTLLGKDLILDSYNRVNDVQAKLDEIRDLNPNLFGGFALIAPDGQVRAFSSNLHHSWPNLLDLPQTRDSFAYTLTTDKMVLGRTYYAPELVMPARKAFYAEDGTPLGVMTGGLNLNSEESAFNKNKLLGDFQLVNIVRTRDRYLQYSSDSKIFSRLHEEPLATSDYRNFLDALSDTAGSIENAMMAKTGVHYIRQTADGKARGIAIYNSRYEFWLYSEIKESFLVKEFLTVFAGYLFLTIVFQVAMYFMFRLVDNTEKNQKKVLEYRANHDSLTGLFNRNYLLENFKQWIEDKKTFALLFIDLDNFKGINDTYGHSVGDEFLVHFSHRLKAALTEHDLLIRHGGDEFILLTSGDMDDKEAKQLIAKINNACNDIKVENLTFSPGASVGIAQFPEHGNNLELLLRSADIAMYQAKKSRNSVCVFNIALEQKSQRRARIEQLLRGATKRGEIYLNYQPQVDAEGGFIGVEALVRWQNNELGLVPPDEFIAIAESEGLMLDLGDYIIDTALAEISNIQRSTGYHFRLSINISVRQFTETEFTQRLLQKIAISGIEYVNVALEITESLLIEDLQSISSILRGVHAQGVCISLDDFGTGYSSLSVLRHLPLDEIKIDKSFVEHVIDDDTAYRMIKNIISIGRNYDVAILAEGIETKEQLDCLVACGCDQFQGYFFSRPLTALQLSKYIQDTLSRQVS